MLQDYSLPRREYSSDMAEVQQLGMFITDDEIDATLNRGGNVEGGKGRILSARESYLGDGRVIRRAQKRQP